jgi:cytochrome c oxidase subunit I+III
MTSGALETARTHEVPPRDATPVSKEQQEAFDYTWRDLTGFWGMLRTINNIPIAHKYISAGFVFFLIGGVQALLMRIQLGSPDNTFLDEETYNQLFTMHGTTMMFLFVIPFIEAVANYLLPLLLGTRDLPFPRLTALSFWTYVMGGLFLYSSFLFGVAPDGGWFAYVPLTNKEWSPSINMDYWDIGLSVAEVAALGAAAELVIAVLRARAPGMSLDRIPLFGWSMLVTAVMIIFAFTTLIAGTAMLELDRKQLTAFFVPELGGEPLLWQHLFWVFGHPEVYIMFIPAVGIVSQIVQTFSRRPIVGYTAIVLAMIATGFLSFGLWVHHMFATGLSPVGTGFFAAASMVIAIPNGVQIFSWIATIWTGRPQWKTPLLFCAGFIVIFVLGGVTGVMVAAVPFDWQVHDSYFVVAHMHYVLIGGVVFPLYAGLYYWLPKITGRMTSERLGRWNFWLMFVFFNLAFFPMHVAGFLGMARRIYTYPAGIGLEPYNVVSTVGAIGFGLSATLLVVNFFWSLRRGPKAGRNPWGGDTLEWAEESPPAAAQFQVIPVVRSRHPLWEQEDLAPQDPETARAMEDLHWKPLGWRGALVVSVLEGKPVAVVQMPDFSIWPFVMAIGFVAIFAGALLDNATIALVGAAITAAAVVGWFRPLPAGRKAIEEMGVVPREPGRLAVAVAGPTANGYWGTIVFCSILAVALAGFVGSYFYLGEGPEWPLRPIGFSTRAAAAIGLHAALALLAWGLLKGYARGRVGAIRLVATVAPVVTALAMWATWGAWSSTGLVARQSAYASIVMLIVAYQVLVLVVLAAMQIAALLWAWGSPRDPRGHGVAHNTSIVSWYALASWLVAAATLYLSAWLTGAGR